MEIGAPCGGLSTAPPKATIPALPPVCPISSLKPAPSRVMARALFFGFLGLVAAVPLGCVLAP